MAEEAVKIVLLGDGATGKTAIAQKYCQDFFPSGYKQTIGLDFYQKRMVLAGRNVTVQLWDIGGQTLTSKMTPNLLYGANAIVLVYDITHVGSFQNLEEWIKLIHKTFLGTVEGVGGLEEKDPRLPYMALLGNKSDMSNIRTVKPERHHAFAVEHSLISTFVSAKTGDGIAPSFVQIVADLLGLSLRKQPQDSASPGAGGGNGAGGGGGNGGMAGTSVAGGLSPSGVGGNPPANGNITPAGNAASGGSRTCILQ